MKKTMLVLLSSLVLLLICSCATIKTQEDNKLKIRFFSIEGVDQWGDCTLIQFPNGESMMIDFGYAEVGDIVAKELKEKGIMFIDYAVFSHSHSDHTNGYLNLQSNGIRFKKAMTNGYYPQNYAWMSSNFSSFGMEEIILSAGDSFDIGDVHFDVLWPVKDKLDYQGIKSITTTSGGNEPGSNDDMNCSSLVLKMTYGDFSVLFTGDIYQHAEYDIIEMYKDNPEILDCDVIKCMHHGKATSSSKEFVNAVSAEIGVVMGTVPMNVSIYKSYCEAGGVVYHTCQNGNVYIESDGNGYTFTADKMELSKTFDAVVKMVNGGNN